jgi:DNA invertase Pin-like site-specific DNA recombinase
MPPANRLTIDILAAEDDHEHEMISQRTKAALAEAERRGAGIGDPCIEAAQALGLAAHHAHRPAPEVRAIMAE